MRLTKTYPYLSLQLEQFYILGNGNLERNLKLLVKQLNIDSNVVFIDMIPHEKMVDFYSAADIFCLPSIHEGFPLSIAEALSIGLTIVASKTEGIPEAIIENKNGYLVEPGNVRELSEKLIKALKLSNDEITKFQKNNRELARKDYYWEKIMKKIENVYVESIKNKFNN